ncbi:hypothetical protein [Bacillus smithii]|uniref:hypothetical protein n=1 Tax=Bacillus smithii TaxID=1479 RepID=UPI0022E421D1|nr:hypothetical protein [Bacillus smithii]
MFNGYNLYSLDGKTDSLFLKGELINVDDFKGSWHIRGNRHWEKYLGVEKIEKGITEKAGSYKEPNDFQRNGIAYEFSKLKTEDDINKFANKYGLLGIGTPSYTDAVAENKVRKMLSPKNPLFKPSYSFFTLSHGRSYFEPLEIWWFHIQQIRNLLKLYKTLVNIHNGSENENDIECKVLNIGEKVDGNEGSFYIIEWSDGNPTGCLIHSEPVEKGDFLGIARTVLIRNVNEQTHRSINNIATDIIETNKPPLGFIVQESKTTNYLINAIYYDLWDLISKNEPVYICANPNCKLPFKKVKRQKYCSNACKQEAYRIRKKQKQS